MAVHVFTYPSPYSRHSIYCPLPLADPSRLSGASREASPPDPSLSSPSSGPLTSATISRVAVCVAMVWCGRQSSKLLWLDGSDVINFIAVAMVMRTKRNHAASFCTVSANCLSPLASAASTSTWTVAPEPSFLFHLRSSCSFCSP